MEAVKSRSRLEDNELLLLKNYKCNTCGLLSEFLQSFFTGPGFALSCEHCGSTDLKKLADGCKDHYYW